MDSNEMKNAGRRAAPLRSGDPATAGAASDRKRIDAYLDGETAAFREVDRWIRVEVQARYPILRAELDDLCQMVHEKLVGNLGAGRFGHRSTLRTYVAGITHYTSIDCIRKRHREQSLPSGWEERREATTDSPYRSLSDLQEQELLHQAVMGSPAACRELWRLIFVERLSYKDVGSRLSIPPGTVKSRMWYCRRKAMALLERLRRIASRGLRRIR